MVPRFWHGEERAQSIGKVEVSSKSIGIPHLTATLREGLVGMLRAAAPRRATQSATAIDSKAARGRTRPDRRESRSGRHVLGNHASAFPQRPVSPPTSLLAPHQWRVLASQAGACAPRVLRFRLWVGAPASRCCWPRLPGEGESREASASMPLPLVADTQAARSVGRLRRTLVPSYGGRLVERRSSGIPLKAGLLESPLK